MRTDVSFPSAGLTCRGWLYRPAGDAPAPAIVMTHGFSAVKEQGLAGFAEVFQAAGFAVLAFDCRFLGASDGAERGRIIAQEQHDDLRAALAWISAQPGIDPHRIGLWGSSFSGAHGLFLGALDPRVKAIVAQAPAIDVAGSLAALAGREGFAGYLHMLAADHAARTTGAEGGRIPVVAPAGQPSVLSTPDSYDWFTQAHAQAPNWFPTTTLESVARMLEYQPASFIELISPKPLLIIAALEDSLVPIDQVRRAFARAGEPKKLLEFAAGHFDFYPGQKFHTEAATAARDWFKAALMG